MTESTITIEALPRAETVTVSRRRLALCRAVLSRSRKRLAAYRRRLAPKRYGLKQYNRMRATRFSPEFLFPDELPAGQKVLLVLPHHHEAAKVGGLIHGLMARGEGGRPRNSVHAVVVMPSHRSISPAGEFRKREDMIDAVNREMLEWAYVIGMDLGLPPWDPSRPLKHPATDLPEEASYVRRRVGDQFVYGPSGAYRFFNGWRTYDSGEIDQNRQHVAAEDQREFCQVVREENPDIVLLPDQMDPHPSHRTTRELTMEALRSLLAETHADGGKRVMTLMEYASFHLTTPPRYNLWALAPKELVRMKTEANKVFKLQKKHDYEMDQIMSERVSAIAADDEFSFARNHSEQSCFSGRLSQNAPTALPPNTTAENFTVSILRVVDRRGIPVVLEARVGSPRRHFLSMLPRGVRL